MNRIVYDALTPLQYLAGEILVGLVGGTATVRNLTHHHSGRHRFHSVSSTPQPAGVATVVRAAILMTIMILLMIMMMMMPWARRHCWRWRSMQWSIRRPHLCCHQSFLEFVVVVVVTHSKIIKWLHISSFVASVYYFMRVFNCSSKRFNIIYDWFEYVPRNPFKLKSTLASNLVCVYTEFISLWIVVVAYIYVSSTFEQISEDCSNSIQFVRLRLIWPRTNLNWPSSHF